MSSAAQTTADPALLLSVVSLVLASISIAWNIYKDVFLRPRSHITGYKSFINNGEQEHGPYITLRLTNLGPGKIIVTGIVAKESGFLKRVFQRKHGIQLNYDWENQFNTAMPMTADSAESVQQLLRYEESCVLKTRIRSLGFIDSRFKYHWISKEDLRKLKQVFGEDFPNTR